MLCKGRAEHTEQAARSVAATKTAHGVVKYNAIHCQECSLWHVSEVVNGEHQKTL
jgi:hypothetical protein